MKEAAHSGELAPVGGKAGEFGMAMIEEYGELLCRERMERVSL